MKRLLYRAIATFRIPVPERLFFLHFEKCAGTSVGMGLKTACGFSSVLAETRRPTTELDPEASASAARKLDVGVFRYREELAHYFLSGGDRKYVQGHFQVSPRLMDSFGDRWLFVTVLREPTERWLSHYYFNRHKKRSHGKIDEELQEYLESERGRALGSDYVSVLTGRRDEGTRGWETSRPFSPSGQLVEQAKATLSKFDLVGLVSDLQSFADRVERRIGRRPRFPRMNVRRESSRRPTVEELPEPVREQIREVCRPNSEIFRYVQDRLAAGPPTTDR